MTETAPDHPHLDECPRRDRGFTLIEILIVTTILGMIVAALSGAVIVVLRASPTTEVRIDDARSTRGLSTWLSHDVASTPAFSPPEPGRGGFVTGAGTVTGANECAAPGNNILEMTWVERITPWTTHVASYRIVSQGETSTLRRYSCSRTGTGPYSVPTSANLTAGLRAEHPVSATLVRDGGTGPVIRVELRLTGRSGETVIVDTASRNPSEFFPA